jgi:SAM-dependent methyltransferase
MTGDRIPPTWRLPPGVNRSLWEYAHSERLAEEEDEYFRDHPLLSTDARYLDDRYSEPGPLVDLGCGSGRLSLHFARRGFRVLAIDLSRPMLRVLNRKARAEGAAISTVQANLCNLRFLPSDSFQYALSMFSTLGMIRGNEARRKALSETWRILIPGGRLALHAHNLWLNLFDPQGRRWLLGQAFGGLTKRPELGDRRMLYRGVPGMEVHLYRWTELRNELTLAGFEIEKTLAIDAISGRVISAAWLLPGLRAGGWVVFARKPSTI